VKKNLLAIAVLMFFIKSSLFAQAFMKDTKTINLGLGLGYGLGILGSAEVGVANDISAGVVGGFSRRSYGVLGNSFGVTYIVAGVRGSYHFGRILSDAGVNVDKFDPYAGVTGGFRSVNYDDSWRGYSGVKSGVMLGGYLGLRYQVNDNLGIMAEGGTPFSTIGITFKR
jgi:hypothetical protein